MARAPRIIVPGLPHHVVLRGNNRRRLFSSKLDYRMFLYFAGLSLKRCQVGLHALTLMSNHAHLLVTPRHQHDLAAFVKPLAQRYAQLRNEKRNASGKLFEERYWSR